MPAIAPANPVRALTPLSKEQSTSLPALAAALPQLGFARLFEQEFVSIDSLAYRHQAQMTSRRFAHRSLDKEKPVEPVRVQWWRHPAGVLARTQHYRDGNGQWQAGELELGASIDLGHGKHGSQFFSFSYLEDGRAAHFLRTSRDPGELAKAWSTFREAAIRGQLLPLSLRAGQQSLLAGMLTQQPSPGFARAIKQADPSDIASKITEDYRHRHALPLANAWRRQFRLAQLPPAEQQFWLGAIAEQVVNARWWKMNQEGGSAASDDYRSLPRWVRGHAPETIRGNRASQRFQRAAAGLDMLLAEVGVATNNPLSSAERDVARQWLQVVSDPRHPRHLDAQLRQASALDLRGVQFHQLLFETINQPGSLNKALWWQSQQSPERLKQLCREPGSDGANLPMLWARAWLAVPNARVVPRRQHQRAAGARRPLDQLAELGALPEAPWVTPARTVWNEALAPDINLPSDEDLLAVHAPALADFVDYLLQRPASVPTHLVLQDAVVDLLAPGALARAIDALPDDGTSPRWAGFGTGEQRAALLDPAVARLSASQLEASVPAALASQPRRVRL